MLSCHISQAEWHWEFNRDWHNDLHVLKSVDLGALDMHHVLESVVDVGALDVHHVFK